MNAPLCFLDIESDGVHPGRKAWEIALIRREPSGLQHEVEFFVDIDLDTADPFGLRVGRFYERHPYGRYLSGELPDFVFGVKDDGDFLRPRDAAETVARYTHGANIVGIVPNFDTEVLAALLREQHLTPAWHHHLCDAGTLALGYLHGLSSGELRELLTPPWDYEAISRAVGVEPPNEEERHTAMGDAKWAMRLFDEITGGAE